jgi:hypothetical protein
MQEVPVTQASEAVKALITYQNHGQPPAEMPDFYKLKAELVLVQNGKRDAYYICTPKTCSCPAAHWNKGACKHQRKFFPEPKAPAMKPSEPLVERGGFKPFSLLPFEEKGVA